MKLKKDDAKRLFPDAPDWFKTKLRDKFGTALFSDFNDIKTFEDACAVLGIDPEKVVAKTDTPDEAAYKKLKVIAKAINNGWEPDWDDTDEKKWWPWFNLSSGFGFSGSTYDFDSSYSTVGSRLCFESKEKSTYAAETFLSIYEELLTIKK